MRRFGTVVVCAALLVPLWTVHVEAAPQRSTAQSYNAFWHTKRKVDQDTYLKTTWYAGVYDYGDGFWSDLYKSVDRCEKREGRDRCRSDSYLIGVINRLGTGEFTLDRKLTTGTFRATYPMEKYVPGEDERDIGQMRISVDLVGTGDLTTSRESYSVRSGCFSYQYNGRRTYRDATATGVVEILSSDQTVTLRETDDANISIGSNFYIENTCDKE